MLVLLLGDLLHEILLAVLHEGAEPIGPLVELRELRALLDVLLHGLEAQRGIDALLRHLGLHAHGHLREVVLLVRNLLLRDVRLRLDRAPAQHRIERVGRPLDERAQIQNARRIERAQIAKGLHLLHGKFHVEIAGVDFDHHIPLAIDVFGLEGEALAPGAGHAGQFFGSVKAAGLLEHGAHDFAPEAQKGIYGGLLEHGDAVGLLLGSLAAGVLIELAAGGGFHLHAGVHKRRHLHELKIIHALHGDLRIGPEDELEGSALHEGLARRRGHELRVVGARIALGLNLLLMRGEGAREAAAIGELAAEALAGARIERVATIGIIVELALGARIHGGDIPHGHVNAGHAELIGAAFVAPPDLEEEVVFIDHAAGARERNLLDGAAPILVADRLAAALVDHGIHPRLTPLLRGHALAQLDFREPLAAVDRAGALELGGAHGEKDILHVFEHLHAGAILAHDGYGQLRAALLAQHAHGGPHGGRRDARIGAREPGGKFAVAQGVERKIVKIRQHGGLQPGIIGGDVIGIALTGDVEDRQIIKRKLAADEGDILPPVDLDDGQGGIIPEEMLRGELHLRLQLGAHLAIAQPAQERGDAGGLGRIVGLDGGGLHLGAEERLLYEGDLIADD